MLTCFVISALSQITASLGEMGKMVGRMLVKFKRQLNDFYSYLETEKEIFQSNCAIMDHCGVVTYFD